MVSLHKIDLHFYFLKIFINKCDEIMIVHTPTKQRFNNRLECKRALGGEVAYNKALKNGELVFINTPGVNDIWGFWPD